MEDEIALSETLVYNLERQGYDVVAAMEGHEALKLARSHNSDLIILDLMLSDIDGLETTRILRKESGIPNLSR